MAVEICKQLIKTYNILWGGGGEEYLDFWNRGAYLGWAKVLWSQRCHLQVLKFGVGEILWGLTFLAEYNRN